MLDNDRLCRGPETGKYLAQVFDEIRRTADVEVLIKVLHQCDHGIPVDTPLLEPDDMLPGEDVEEFFPQHLGQFIIQDHVRGRLVGADQRIDAELLLFLQVPQDG